MPSSVPPVFAPRWGNKPVVVWLHKMNRVGQNCSSFEQMRVCKKKINFLFRRSHSERFERGLLLLCANCVCVFCPYHWSNPPCCPTLTHVCTPVMMMPSHLKPKVLLMQRPSLWCHHDKYSVNTSNLMLVAGRKRQSRSNLEVLWKYWTEGRQLWIWIPKW